MPALSGGGGAQSVDLAEPRPAGSRPGAAVVSGRSSQQHTPLPWRASVAERLTLVRQSLCRPAAVRAVYFSSTSEVQAAAQRLRTLPRCLSPKAVTTHFGAIRPLSELRRNRPPQTLAEQLLFNGWLLPRPVARNHPACYVVPPEVRAWLPVPLGALDERRTTNDERRQMTSHGRLSLVAATRNGSKEALDPLQVAAVIRRRRLRYA